MQSTSLILMVTCLVPCFAFYNSGSFSFMQHHQRCVQTNRCGYQDGRFPSCTSCGEYVSCRGGQYTLTQCPYSLTYDIFLSICIPGGFCDVSSLVEVQPRNQNPTTTSSPDIEPRVSDDPSGSTTTSAGQSTAGQTSVGQTTGTTSSTSSATSTTTTTTPSSTTQTSTTTTSTTSTSTSTTSTTTATTSSTTTSSTTANPTTTEVTPEIENRVTGPGETTPAADDSPEVQGRELKIITQTDGRFRRNLIFETGCFKSCAGLPSGSYPSCAGCNKVLICYGNHEKRKTCFLGETFDDATGICQRYSSTCRVEVKRLPTSYFNEIGYSDFL